MRRLIDIDVRRGVLWVSFPYDARLVAIVKTLDQRHWEPQSKRWAVPLSLATPLVERLGPHHFSFTPRMRDWWLEHRGDAPPDDVVTAVEIDPNDGYTVTRLNEAARQALNESLGNDVWVIAELEGFDRGGDREHQYFELVDRVAPGGDILAKLPAVMFSAARRRVRAQAGDLELRDGLMVRLQGRLDIYGPQGRYQFVVEGIDADWSAGALLRRRDEVLKQLEKRGLLTQNVGREMPTCPLRVGLVTASDSDAVNDFLDELRSSGFGFVVTLHDARMQGAQTEASVTAALQWFAERAEEFDVVVVTRGGGSRTDLSHFDSLPIGVAVCEHPVKVVCGIGHHRDRCVLDFAAHSVKTPTAAGQLLVSLVQEFMDDVHEQGTAVERATQSRLVDAERSLERAGALLERHATRRLQAANRRCVRAEVSVVDGARTALKAARLEVAENDAAASRAASRALERAGQRLDYASRGLETNRLVRSLRRPAEEVERLSDRLERVAERKLEQAGLRIHHAEAKLRLSDPRRILQRGFAIVRDAEGGIITTASSLAALPEAAVELPGGVVRVEPLEDSDGG